MQKVYNLEVLKMKIEYLKDENGLIWLTWADDIQVRNTPGK